MHGPEGPMQNIVKEVLHSGLLIFHVFDGPAKGSTCKELAVEGSEIFA